MKKKIKMWSQKDQISYYLSIYIRILFMIFSICDFYFAGASIAFQDMAINPFCSVPAHYSGSVFEGIAAYRDLMLWTLDGGFLDFRGF